MDAITYSTARAHLASTMDRVCEDHEPLIITRNSEQSVVMLSLEDYKALEDYGYELGFSHVASGPLVRSSYHADRSAKEAGVATA